MATVTIDISEYDMLRNGKEQAEAEVKTLKEDIKGLKDKSRVIVTTITKVKERSEYSLLYGCESERTISTSESTQLTGFDDIEFEIREKLTKKVQKELDERLKFLEQARKNYEEERASLEPDLKEKFEEDKSKLAQDYEKKLTLLQNFNETLKSEIHDLWRPRLERAQENLNKIPNWIQKLFGVKLQA